MPEIILVDNEYFSHYKFDFYNCFLELLNDDEKLSKELTDNMEVYLDDKSAIVHAANINNKVIGFIWGYFINTNTVHINYFIVRKSFRNNGLGSVLLNNLITNLPNNNFELLVRKDNQKAISFYEKNKFVKHDYNETKYKMILGS